jgi:hypothetical protein
MFFSFLFLLSFMMAKKHDRKFYRSVENEYSSVVNYCENKAKRICNVNQSSTSREICHENLDALDALPTPEEEEELLAVAENTSDDDELPEYIKPTRELDKTQSMTKHINDDSDSMIGKGRLSRGLSYIKHFLSVFVSYIYVYFLKADFYS